MKKVLFTSDLLKIDDRKQDVYSNPQEINIDWIYALFSKNLDIFGQCQTIKLLGTEDGFNSIRWNTYNSLGLPMTSNSWALLYEGEYGLEVISEILLPYLNDIHLVVGFELPPYLIKILNLNKISYIDFTIHPIRFLPDYIFGVRSNIPSVQQKLEFSQIPETLIYDFARISKSRTTRIARNASIAPNSVLFLGQIEIDSSLIQNGCIATQEDIENALIELSMIYPKVYYKAHPHVKNLEQLKKSISKINKCQWFEMNIYDALAQDSFSLVATMSSGSAYEAIYFDKKIKTYLDVKKHFDLSNPIKEEVYYPIYKDIFNISYWDYLFNNASHGNFSKPDPFEGALKFSLNMKWGR